MVGLADLTAARSAVARSRSHRVKSGLLLLLFALVGIGATYLVYADMRAGYPFSSPRTQSEIRLVAAIVATAALALLFPRLLSWLIYGTIRLIYVRSWATRSHVSFQLDDAGVTFTRKIKRTFAAWDSITRAVALRQALVLFSGHLPFVIPKRAFGSEQDFTAACQFAHDKVAQNNAAKSAAPA